MSKLSRLVKNTVERLFDTRRLSNFEMVEPPLSADQLRELLDEALAKFRAEGKDPTPSQMFGTMRTALERMAVAEVTLTSGVWPLRKSRRIRIFRRSSHPNWAFENGDWTPGLQAEDLERKWAMAYDYQRQFGLQRSLELSTSQAPASK